MRISSVLKVLLFIPPVIAGGFVVMFMSYLLVPMIIVGTVGMVIYTATQQDKEEPHAENDNWTY